MPFLRRPSTDAGRYRLLKAAKQKADAMAPASPAFSAATLALIVAFLPTLEAALTERGGALGIQSTATRAVEAAKRILVMWVTHFIEALNKAIKREELDAGDRGYYQLPVTSARVPRLVTDQEVDLWAGRIATGEAARIAAGGTALTAPSAAQVAAKYTIYTDAQADQTGKKDTFDLDQEAVAAMRHDADDIITDLLDELNFTFRKDSASSRRRKMREYGVIFVPRKNEAPDPEDFAIMGTVTDSITSQPIEDAIIVQQSPEINLITDEHGKYFVPRDAAGTFTILAHKDGYVDREITNVVVVDGVITVLDIQLTAVGTISGHVSGPTTPGPFNLTITGQAGGAVTDGSNDYSIDAPAGTQTITCSQASNPANMQSQTINVPAGGSVTVNFVFP